MAARSPAIARRSATTATAVASPPAPAPKMPMSPAWRPLMMAAFAGPVVRREQRVARDDGRRHPGGQRRAARVERGERELTDRPAATARPLEVGDLERGRSIASRCCDGIDAKRERRARTGSRAWRARRGRRDRRTDPPRRSPRSRASDSACAERTAGRFHPRQHGVRRPVQNADDAREPIAGEPFADGADDRHRAADRRFVAKLPALALGQRQERRPFTGDDLLVRGDDRLPRA